MTSEAEDTPSDDDSGAAPPLAPDKLVTNKVLRAAARTPSDVKEIVIAEVRTRARQDSERQDEVPEDDDPSEDDPAAEADAATEKPAPAKPTTKAKETPPAKPEPKAKPAATAKPEPKAKPAATAKPDPKAKPVAAPEPKAMPVAAPEPKTKPAATAKPDPRAKPAATPARQATRVRDMAPASATTSAKPTPRPATTARAARPSPASQPPSGAPAPAAPAPAPPTHAGPLLAAAISLGLIVAGSAFVIAAALDRQAQAMASLGERPVQVDVASPPPTAAQSRGGGAALAELGGGRVVHATETGDLVVLRRDPTSGELEVERVYDLVLDTARHQGDPTRRLHGYYLDDVAVQRREAIEAAKTRYEAAVARSERTFTDLDAAERAAGELARLGGAEYLVKFLSPEETQLRRRTAAVGLGSSGYLCAVDPLLALLRDHVQNPKYFAELTRLLEALTGLDLDPKAFESTIRAVEGWSLSNPLPSPFARAAQ